MTAKDKKKKSAVKVAKSAVTGEFLEKKGVRRYFPFLLFVAALSILVIANDYYAERMYRKRKSLQKDIEFYYSMYEAERTRKVDSTRQSNLVKKLEKQGIKEALDKVQKITVTEEAVK